MFDAACKVVGEVGYAEASVARITELAGVAQGTFYNHFESRQALFDSLLPTLGKDMARFIQDRTETIRPEADREAARFAAFFDYLETNPGFLRILNEAEFAAPSAYRAHIENMAGPFKRILINSRRKGELNDFDDTEIEVLVHILMGARSYLSQRYGSQGEIPGTVFSAYSKLLVKGLFSALD